MKKQFENQCIEFGFIYIQRIFIFLNFCRKMPGRLQKKNILGNVIRHWSRYINQGYPNTTNRRINIYIWYKEFTRVIMEAVFFFSHPHTQLHPTLCDPLDCSPPGSSVHGIFQARILEWVAISSSRGSSWPRDWTHISCVSCTAGEFFTGWATREAQPGIEVPKSAICKLVLESQWSFSSEFEDLCTRGTIGVNPSLRAGED